MKSLLKKVDAGRRAVCIRLGALCGGYLTLPGCQTGGPKDKEGAAGVSVTTLKFQSGGKSIRVDRYRPAGITHGTAPGAVVVLHGAGGVLFDGPEMRRTATALALAGQDAYLLHYFNRAGGPVTMDAGMTRHFAEWLETVRDAVTWIQSDEKQDGNMGLFGYSLGGFLALAESFHDSRIAYVVVHAGGIWEGYEKGVSRVPQVLLIHGKRDERVPFQRYMPRLEKFLKEKGVPAQTAYYEAEAHRFEEPSQSGARQRAVRFLAR